MANKTFVTPKGTAIFPKLNTPDTKFNAAGVYEVKLAFDADTPGLDKFRQIVEQMVDERFDEEVKALEDAGKGGLAKKLTKVSPFKAEEDPATGDETGRILVKAKMTASGISKKTGKPWTRKPNIFDAKGLLIKNPPQIGGGSEMKVSVELVPYVAQNDKTVGVSLRLGAAQIIKLVVFGSRDAAGYGFGEEEGDDLSGYAEQEFGVGADAGNAPDDDDL
ncbi:hypothetical protein [Sphingomonas sp.]|uniref:hypothetical protein n=1 Tax=Sphingomonas sp. TaxID=28214 RepID=UPI002ED7731C